MDDENFTAELIRHGILIFVFQKAHVVHVERSVYQYHWKAVTSPPKHVLFVNACTAGSVIVAAFLHNLERFSDLALGEARPPLC